MMRSWLRSLARLLFRNLSRVIVEGVENIPEEGPCLLAANHLSRLDSPLIFSLVERGDLTGLVADKYKKYPFFYALINPVNVIWIHREGADFQALRDAINYLKRGGLVGLAPEGTRSTTGALMAAKTGAAYLADRAQAPVIPAAIWGTETAMRELLHLRRPCITVRFGAPFTLPPIERGERNAGLRRNTDEIMKRIAALLPQKYRGAYAEGQRMQNG
jgi:1-acyl-sn-glycerol-3-phosphate acyltransferase